MRSSGPLLVSPALVALTLCLPAHAEFSGPTELRVLAREAALIVVARVERVEERTLRPGESLGSHVASLTIEGTLKGESPRQLEVRYDPGVRCPPPPRYQPGSRALVFLTRRGERWWTFGSAHGCRSLQGTGHPRDLVREVQRLLLLDQLPLLGRLPLVASALRAAGSVERAMRASALSPTWLDQPRPLWETPGWRQAALDLARQRPREVVRRLLEDLRGLANHIRMAPFDPQAPSLSSRLDSARPALRLVEQIAGNHGATDLPWQSETWQDLQGFVRRAEEAGW